MVVFRNIYDRRGFYFLVSCFVLGIPTWYLHKIADENMALFIWDFSQLTTINLIPFIIYSMVDSKPLKWLSLAYGYWMLTNLLVTYEIYWGDTVITDNVMIIQVLGIAIISIVFLWRIRRAGKL